MTAITERRPGVRSRLWGQLGMGIVKAGTFSLTTRSWSGTGNIPSVGGFIVAANHIGEFDPLVLAHFMLDAGRWPRFLTKSSLFDVPLLGSLLGQLRQIPVTRGGAGSRAALDTAAEAVRAGHGVVVYPEGTTPKDGDLTLRRGKPGIARLFLATGAPVIPVATWGPQEVFDPRTHTWKIRGRTRVAVHAGEPVDLGTWTGATPTAGNLRTITADIMAAVDRQLSVVQAQHRETAS